jgi:threonine/homoserine/homoserine lactone efflux protein
VLAAKLAELRPLLGGVSVAGGAFVLYLAWDTFRPPHPGAEALVEPPRSWLKGFLTNLLSPHPWLFWLTVGAAILAKAIAQSWVAAVAFLSGFYLLLVGSKLGVALLAGRSRDLLAGRPYRVAMRGLAVLLAGFALLLFRDPSVTLSAKNRTSSD